MSSNEQSTKASTTKPQQDQPTMQCLEVDQVVDLLRTVKTAAICGHVNPDGDSIGANLALCALLRQMGVQTTSLLAQDQPAPDLYDFLEGYEFTPAEHYTATPDIFIAVDSPSIERIGKAADVAARARQTLVIDHHPNFQPYSRFYLGDASAPSTCSLIWHIIQAANAEPTPQMAAYCYVGLMTDTGRFSFQNTDAQSFIDAAQMVRLGVDPALMSHLVYESKSLQVMQLESRLIDRMAFSCDGRVAYSWIDEHDFNELGLDRDDTEGLPTILRSIAGVEVSALLREEQEGVRVNLRSSNGCDVGLFARNHGGGGHAAAAGLTLKMPLSGAIKTFIPQLSDLVCGDQEPARGA